MLRGNENKICFVIIGVIVGCLALGGVTQAGWSEQARLTASDANDQEWFGYSVSISSEQAIVGGIYDDDNGTKSGSAYIFRQDPNTGSWSEQAKLTASDGNAFDYFGVSVSISGDYAIVGASQDDDNGDNCGSAYIFKRDPNTESWSERTKLTASDGAAFDRFGISVSISCEYAIVGSYSDDGNSWGEGAAYIFKASDDSNDPNWYQQAKLTASEAVSGSHLGRSVFISGDYAIAGAYGPGYDGNDPGSAYIFEMPVSGWVDANETAKLSASDGQGGDEFGISVSISAGYAIVGAYLDDDNGNNSGSAYIFEMPVGGWVDANETIKLIASDGAAEDGFGYSVSIDADYAVVGAYHGDGNEPNCGSAYIFTPNDIDPNNWYQQAKLTASDGTANDRLGLSVSISGEYAIAGAPWDDDNGNRTGSAYMFKLCPTADLSGDCCVDLTDFAILGGQWHQAPSEPSADIGPTGGDGVVDFLDLAVLVNQWLQCY